MPGESSRLALTIEDNFRPHTRLLAAITEGGRAAFLYKLPSAEQSQNCEYDHRGIAILKEAKRDLEVLPGPLAPTSSNGIANCPEVGRTAPTPRMGERKRPFSRNL
tara:strand:- start:5796 stop:6113 length:318 start_codon:yes stop_codon:yes gene_type:complete